MTSADTPEEVPVGTMNEAKQMLSDFDAPDIGPKEEADHTAKMTANVLEATKIIEVIEIKAGPGQMHFLARVKQKTEKKFLDGVVEPILRLSEKLGIDCHIGKQFFLKNDSMRYGWNVSFAAEDLRAVGHAISAVLEPIVPKLHVMESPLQGSGTPQNTGPGGGKGAHETPFGGK